MLFCQADALIVFELGGILIKVLRRQIIFPSSVRAGARRVVDQRDLAVF